MKRDPEICEEADGLITPGFRAQFAVASDHTEPVTPDDPAARRAEERWRERGVPVEPLRRVLGLAGFLGPTQSMRGARQMEGALWGVLCGAVGCGKTTAAVWWIMRHKGGRWCKSHKLARLPEGAQWATRELAELERAPALVIDDVGFEDGDGRGRLAVPLRLLIVGRLEGGLPTLWTTNVAPAAVLQASRGPWPGISLEEYLSEPRLVDRWRQHGQFHASDQGSLRRGGGA